MVATQMYIFILLIHVYFNILFGLVNWLNTNLRLEICLVCTKMHIPNSSFSSIFASLDH